MQVDWWFTFRAGEFLNQQVVIFCYKLKFPPEAQELINHLFEEKNISLICIDPSRACSREYPHTLMVPSLQLN